MLEALALACIQIVDGDTLKLCDGERIRLADVDAPELRCPRTRKCVPGDPYAAKEALRRAVSGKRLTMRRITKDRYGRTVAVVYADGANIACGLLAGGFVAYTPYRVNGGIVARDCGVMK